MNNDEIFENEELDEIQADAESKSEPSKKKELFEWFDVVSVALICVMVVFGFVFRIATISGGSMLNTLAHNEKVIITNLFYTPKAGDIVVISRNIENAAASGEKSQGPIIKRVIATENQVVDIDFLTGEVKVDGKVLEENYISTPTLNSYDVEFPVTVPKGHIFVLGDNRAVSLDSRSSHIGTNGMIDERYVLGRAVFRILPFDKMGSLTNK